ncbi:MAG: hypothetical protein J7601_11560 [Chloroflexi bacterium]|jgi:hypothetical protein|nr:hypothetical protein [Chloroflexota bacterium]
MIYVAEHIEPACLPLPAILIAHPLDQAAAMRMMQNAPPACLSEDLRRRLERLGAQLRPIPRLPRLEENDKVVVVSATTTTLSFALVCVT